MYYGHPAKPIYGDGKPIVPRYSSKRITKVDQQTYLPKLLPLEEYDLIIVLSSGGKDSTAAYYYLIELGVPKRKIELWHHDLNGAHPTRMMDWPVTMAYVDAFAKAEGVRRRFSRRVNGYWGEVYRIGASYPIEYESGDGIFTECSLSDLQYESDELRLKIMKEVLPDNDVAQQAFESSAELNRAWCARCEEKILQDIITVEMDKLDRIGNKRIFPIDADTNQQGCRAPGSGSKTVRDYVSALKHLQPFHLRLPAIQSMERGRYCTSVGKAKVLNRALVSMTGKKPVKLLIVSGERRGESKNRAGYNEVELHPANATIKGSRLVHWWRPVIDHSEKDIWERIKRHRCVPHPVYDCGWNRCSCMLCIFSKREQWAGIRELFPAEYERLANDERILGFNMHIGKTLDEYVGDAVSCVCHGNAKAIEQLVNGVFSPEDIYTDQWTYPAGAFRGSEGGPC